MQVADEQDCAVAGVIKQSAAGEIPETWPGEVDLILSAMDAGRHDADASNRRALRRHRYRVRGLLRLFADGAGTSPRIIYTRDIHARGVGFLTPHRLPLGYGGLIEIPRPDGGVARVHCTLLRCRQAAPGWFEGALYFNREQPNLIPDASQRPMVRRTMGLVLSRG